MKKIFLPALILISLTALSQCASDTSIHSFTINSVTYEVVKENRTWVAAAACASARGGKLAEINSKAEQDSIFSHLAFAGIDNAATTAPDGGGASYIWLGGNDMANEGSWVWDGKNSGTGIPFWNGTSTGTAVNGAFTNWGNEPDNYNGQDALALALTNWPLGTAGHWNDVNENNTLFYLIEYPMNAASVAESLKVPNNFYPSPATDRLNFKQGFSDDIKFTIVDQHGATIGDGTMKAGQQTVSLQSLPAGFYLFKSAAVTFKFLKE